MGEVRKGGGSHIQKPSTVYLQGWPDLYRKRFPIVLKLEIFFGNLRFQSLKKFEISIESLWRASPT